MKKITLLSLFFVVSLALITFSCKKDDSKGDPTIAFKTGTGYTSSNATVKYGDTLLIGIHAVSNGSDKISNIKLFANGQAILDSTVSVFESDMSFNIIKGASVSEVWKFVVVDVAMHTDTISLTISRNGEITTYNTINLGAQANATVPSFLSLSDGVTYMQGEAFNNQEKIDMFCFYEDSTFSTHNNFTTLAAPGSNITGIFTGGTAPDNYDVKNVTYFVKSTLTAQQFDAITNDEAIIESFVPANQGKKAKNLAQGNVWAFKTQSGKYGLLKVTAVTHGIAGSMTMDVKIQKTVTAVVQGATGARVMNARLIQKTVN